MNMGSNMNDPSELSPIEYYQRSRRRLDRAVAMANAGNQKAVADIPRLRKELEDAESAITPEERVGALSPVDRYVGGGPGLTPEIRSAAKESISVDRTKDPEYQRLMDAGRLRGDPAPIEAYLYQRGQGLAPIPRYKSSEIRQYAGGASEAVAALDPITPIERRLTRASELSTQGPANYNANPGDRGSVLNDLEADLPESERQGYEQWAAKQRPLEWEEEALSYSIPAADSAINTAAMVGGGAATKAALSAPKTLLGKAFMTPLAAAAGYAPTVAGEAAKASIQGGGLDGPAAWDATKAAVIAPAMDPWLAGLLVGGTAVSAGLGGTAAIRKALADAYAAPENTLLRESVEMVQQKPERAAKLQETYGRDTEALRRYQDAELPKVLRQQMTEVSNIADEGKKFDIPENAPHYAESASPVNTPQVLPEGFPENARKLDRPADVQAPGTPTRAGEFIDQEVGYMLRPDPGSYPRKVLPGAEVAAEATPAKAGLQEIPPAPADAWALGDEYLANRRQPAQISGGSVVTDEAAPGGALVMEERPLVGPAERFETRGERQRALGSTTPMRSAQPAVGPAGDDALVASATPEGKYLEWLGSMDTPAQKAEQLVAAGVDKFVPSASVRDLRLKLKGLYENAYASLTNGQLNIGPEQRGVMMALIKDIQGAMDDLATRADDPMVRAEAQNLLEIASTIEAKKTHLDARAKAILGPDATHEDLYRAFRPSSGAQRQIYPGVADEVQTSSGMQPAVDLQGEAALVKKAKDFLGRGGENAPMSMRRNFSDINKGVGGPEADFLRDQALLDAANFVAEPSLLHGRTPTTLSRVSAQTRDQLIRWLAKKLQAGDLGAPYRALEEWGKPRPDYATPLLIAPGVAAGRREDQLR